MNNLSICITAGEQSENHVGIPESLKVCWELFLMCEESILNIK